MNEEIDIIELLQRVKEGKAPKRIEIDGTIYMLKNLKRNTIEFLYYKEDDDGYVLNWFEDVDVFCDTTIKILDKPIIEELKCHNDDCDYVTTAPDSFELMNKINEIIKYINNKK